MTGAALRWRGGYAVEQHERAAGDELIIKAAASERLEHRRLTRQERVFG